MFFPDTSSRWLLCRTVDRARVVYSYAAENPDELSLQVDDVVNVLEKKLEDIGWWKGELRGKVGVFPDNFVELLPPSEVRMEQHILAGDCLFLQFITGF